MGELKKFKAGKDNAPEIDRIISFLHDTESLHGVDYSELTVKLGEVIGTLAKKVSPARMTKHADIVRECTRLIAHDEDWIEAIEANMQLARMFNLDLLICSPDANVRQVGVNMGAALLISVQGLEVEGVVTRDYSKEKINQTLTCQILQSNFDIRQSVDEKFDVMHG
jgi:hypothetical protein